MRPCQKCNAGLMNADKVCPACGAEQQPTVGFLKASNTSPPGESDGDFHRFLRAIEECDLDPIVISAASGIGMVLLAVVVGLSNPVPMLMLLSAAAIMAMVVTAGMLGGG